MVSWRFAFRSGFRILTWSILWWILGTIIAVIISGGMVFKILSNWNTYVSPTAGVNFNNPDVQLAIAGCVIGMIISAILVFATVLKITMETSLEEAKR